MSDHNTDRPGKPRNALVAAFPASTLGVGPPPLLSTVLAAVRLGLQPCTLEKWRTTGEGPRYVKLGRSVRYSVEDLDAFVLQRNRVNTSENNRRAK